MNDKYGTGATLPQLHPDPIMNADLQIELLCAHLDLARGTLSLALTMNVVTPAALSMKDAVRAALAETAPAAFAAESTRVA